jgi:hypothetical protein
MVKITPSQLANMNDSARRLINEYMELHGITLNYFAKQCGCHQNQLWLYLNSGEEKKGLHSGTLEKIGRYMENNK